ncbi:MAG: ComEC family competence protein [Sphingobacteriia bacterium]|nr:ComEC family competence protein [Sphingobacteriia bacterium]
MKFWNPYPFFRLIVPFAGGILFVTTFDKPEGIEIIHLLILSVLLFVAAILANQYVGYSRRWMPGVFIYVLAFVAGFTLTLTQKEIFNKHHFSRYLHGEQVFKIKISDPPAERARSVRIYAKVLQVIDSTEIHPTIGKVLLYFEKDTAALNLKYGDLLLIRSRLMATEPPANPHQFNYKKFLANSNIYHQTYVNRKNWRHEGSRLVNPVFDFSFTARNHMLKLLEKHGLTGQEFAVVSAILLGYDERMEPELRNLYAGAGALHVLCVSGLHVGIIFLIVSFLLKSLQKNKTARLIKFITLLLSIWAYAFITGLSPSVLRAAVMFSLFSWRELRKEKANSYNVLAASAFLLLAFDPFLITKVGFQLSYSAVLGIIALNEPLSKIFVFRNPVAEYIWKLIVVSLAAQIGTFPLAIYYFNQFPLYFLLANIIVIPLVWLIVYTGIITLVTAAVLEVFAPLITKLLYYQVFMLNISVEYINRLPFAKIEGLVLTFTGVILIYLIIILITRFLVKKEGKYGVAILGLSVIFTAGLLYQKAQVLTQEKLVIYKINGHSAMDMFFGHKAIALADSSLMTNLSAINFNTEANRIYSGIKQIKFLNFNQLCDDTKQLYGFPLVSFSPHFLMAGQTRIAIIDANFPCLQPEKPLTTDVVILRNNPKINIIQLTTILDAGLMVFDSSNDYFEVKKWKNYCDNHGFSYWDIREKGAFVRDL